MKVTTDSCLFGAWASQDLQNSKTKTQNLLDIGCGTGLLSLMIAQKNEVLIDAIEIDNNACRQAAENVASSPWKERINVIHRDVLKWAPYQKYDCIIANPPFYESELRSGKSAKDIAHHDEGLKLSELLRFIKQNLTDEGSFYLLLPVKRVHDLEFLMSGNYFHINKKTWVAQSANHEPFRLLLKAGKTPQEIFTETMAIKNSDGTYTPEFANLLKDFYLYL